MRTADVFANLESETQDIRRRRKASGDPVFKSLFSELYVETSRRFADFVEASNGPELSHEIARRFFALYRRYVPQDHPKPRFVAEHWAGYLRTVRRLEAQPSITGYCSALFLGIRAHVCFDLAEAIVETYLANRDHGVTPVEMDEICHYFLQPATDGLFSCAASEFMTLQRREIDGALGRRRSAVLFGCGNRTNGLWVQLVQSWRRRAFSEAGRLMSQNRTPERPYVQAAW